MDCGNLIAQMNYKHEFLDLLLKKDALKIAEGYELVFQTEKWSHESDVRVDRLAH